MGVLPAGSEGEHPARPRLQPRPVTETQAASVLGLGEVEQRGEVDQGVLQLEAGHWLYTRASNEGSRRFHSHGEGPMPNILNRH